MSDGARRSAQAVGRKPAPRDAGTALRAYWGRHRSWLVFLALFLLLDLIVGLAVAASGGHF